MPEQPPQPSSTSDEVKASLRAIAALLHQAPRLSPEAQNALADLLEELSDDLEDPRVPPEKMAHLQESTLHLVQALQKGEDRGVLTSARERLERAVVAAETEAPTAAGLGRRLLETLSNLGI